VQENPFIDWLTRNQRTHPQVAVGIGDDAAILTPDARDAVISTDLICDGVHFQATACAPEQIGHKAMGVNLSDLAAMAAEPIAAFASLLVPSDTEQDYVQRLIDGMSRLAAEFDMTIAGGDTNTWCGLLAINVTVVGRLTSHGPLLRRGAQPGDVLLVTGSLGGSIQGHHLDFTPRVRESLYLIEHYNLSAGMDLSDGLAMDLRRLTNASGCGAEIVARQIPISRAAKRMAQSPEDEIERALGDGEDFELLLAVPPSEAVEILAKQPLDVPLIAIGHCTAGSELWLVDGAEKRPLPERGYEHGADDRQ
jgi:thiamine-monophosphate kinase